MEQHWPAPGPRARALMIGLLLLWQALSLWVLPLMHHEQLFHRDPLNDWQFFWRRLQSIGDAKTEVISGGLLLACFSNAGFILAKAPLQWPMRVLLSGVLMVAPSMGYLAGFGGYSAMEGSCYYPLAVCAAVFLLTAALWQFGPFLRHLSIVQRDDEERKPQKPTAQFGLLHLLLLMGACALVAGMYQWIGGVEVRFFYFALPANFKLALIEIALMGFLITLGTQLASLAPESGPGPWVALLVAPTICILVLLPFFDFLHGLGVEPLLYGYFLATQAMSLAGAWLAMRLLGYRIAYLK